MKYDNDVCLKCHLIKVRDDKANAIDLVRCILIRMVEFFVGVILIMPWQVLFRQWKEKMN